MPVPNTSVSLVSYTKKREIKIYLDQHLYMYLSIFLSFHFAFGNPMTTGKTVHPWFLEVVTGFKQILPCLCLATRQLYSQKLDNVVSGQLYYEPNVIEEVFCGSGSLLEIMHSHFGGFLFFPFENFTLRPTALFIRVSGGRNTGLVKWAISFSLSGASIFQLKEALWFFKIVYPDVSKQHSISKCRRTEQQKFRLLPKSSKQAQQSKKILGVSI